jgi:hypothetical protein
MENNHKRTGSCMDQFNRAPAVEKTPDPLAGFIKRLMTLIAEVCRKNGA